MLQYAYFHTFLVIQVTMSFINKKRDIYIVHALITSEKTER